MGRLLCLQVRALTLTACFTIVVVGKDRVFATQFHPEKSGETGLAILKAFLEMESASVVGQSVPSSSEGRGVSGLARRVIACLDVRSNDDGDLVVTKVINLIRVSFLNDVM